MRKSGEVAYYMTGDEFDKRLKKAIATGRKAKKNSEREQEYFTKTQELLYIYPDFRAKVKQDEIDLERLEQLDKTDDLQKTINARRESMERTKSEIARIDNALNVVRWTNTEHTDEDAYFPIIELIYFFGMSVKNVSEMDRLMCDPCTIHRQRNRLIKRLKNILFGVDGRECD